MPLQPRPARAGSLDTSSPARGERTVEDVYVHIGPLKTGTTFVQNVLFRNQRVLSDAGVLVPRHDWPAHRRAVVTLMDRDTEAPLRAPNRPRATLRSHDPWDRLVHEVDSSGAHTAILSVERLCMAEVPTVSTMAAAFAPARLHVIFTARDLAKVIPADWQTRLRNRECPTWEHYIASVREPGGLDTYGGRFWRQQDPAASLRPWLEYVPPERVSIVTVPASGSDQGLLWQRFSSVVGLEADAFDLDVPRSNTSLGGVEAEVLRRVTTQVVDQLSIGVYTDLVKHFVARELLEGREQSFRLVLPEQEHDWLEPRAEAVIDHLRSAGYQLFGDLADLVPVRTTGSRAPDDVSDTEVLALTEQVLAATIVEMARRGEFARFTGPRSNEAPVSA